MYQRFKTIKGFFDQLVHYKDGIKVGESWPSFFKGSYTHYDTDGSSIGYSDPSLFGSYVHHNEFGGRIGETWTDDFGVSRHYSADKGYIGSSYDGFVSRTTHIDDSSCCLFDDTFDSSDVADSYEGSDW